MIVRIVRLACCALVLGVLGAPPASPQEKPGATEAKPERKYALEVGGVAPFLVADFVAGPHADRPGCPFVMVSNSRRAGVVLLARGEGLSRAVELAKSLEEQAVRIDGHRGFVMAFDAERRAVADAAKAAGLQQFSSGVPRGSSRPGTKVFESLGLPEKADLAVVVVDTKKVKGLWTVSGGDDFQGRRKAILHDAEEMIKAKPSEDGKE